MRTLLNSAPDPPRSPASSRPSHVGDSLRRSCRNQAITQVCAFSSPFWRKMSETGILRQTPATNTIVYVIPLQRHPLVAAFIWQVCVLGSFVAASASVGLIWSRGTLVTIVVLGLVVVGLVAWLCRRFRKIGGAVVGLMCGLLPSALFLTHALVVARQNLYVAVGNYAGTVILAVPGGLAVALAGIICAGQKKALVAT
jgi:hypothetical protein